GAPGCGLSAREFGRHQPIFCIRHYVRVLLRRSPPSSGTMLTHGVPSGGYGFLLRGPAPRGYNGDGESVAGRRSAWLTRAGREPGGRTLPLRATVLRR